MTKYDLLGSVAAQVLRDLAQNPRNNVCPYRFPDPPSARARFRAAALTAVRSIFRRRNLTIVEQDTLAAAEKNLRTLAGSADGLEKTYALLADDVSRQTMVEVMAYRVLGREHVKLTLNTREYWDSLQYIESALNLGPSSFFSPLLKAYLNKYDLGPTGTPITIYNLLLGVYAIFIAEQYACRGPQFSIDAREGDVVVDGGGCWGETALYFANRVGPSGRVISMEFEPDNLRIYNENLALNPELRNRIQVSQAALWDAPEQTLSISANGPGTRVSATPTRSAKVVTTTIDRLVVDGVVPRVDFIKLDIEGAELPALRGAEETLRRFRPRLAVAVYHGLDDFIRIPAYLADLNLGYTFRMRHYTIHAEETVLFAEPDVR